MPTLKREIFMRPNRMTHRFGENTAGNDPYTGGTFELPKPIITTSTPNRDGKGGANIQRDGLHVYTPPMSPIAKAKGGNASLAGPRLDLADEVVERPPVSTARRKVTAGAK